MTRKQLPRIKWFILFLARAFAPSMNDCIQSFSSQPLISCLWAAKLRDLVDKTSGANLQTEGHADVPTQSAKDPWEPEEEDSFPYLSPSWSLAQRLLSSCPNMKYCLEIQVTLTEDWRPYCHPLILGWPPFRRHAARCKNWTHQSSGDRPR